MNKNQHKPHVHKFTKEATKSTQLWDYRDVTEEYKEPGFAGKDNLKIRICIEEVNGKICGAKQAFDLERTKA